MSVVFKHSKQTCFLGQYLASEVMKLNLKDHSIEININETPNCGLQTSHNLKKFLYSITDRLVPGFICIFKRFKMEAILLEDYMTSVDQLDRVIEEYFLSNFILA